MWRRVCRIESVRTSSKWCLTGGDVYILCQILHDWDDGRAGYGS